MAHSSSKLASLALLVLAVFMGPCTAQNSPEDYLGPHNAARDDVGIDPVTWNDTVAAYAQSYAEQRQGDCALEHSQGGPYGENIFWGSAGGDWSAADAVKSWVDEKQYYDHDTNSCSAPEGQSWVWRDTTTIGCARVVCDNDAGVFIICSYDPPGNVVGQSPY